MELTAAPERNQLETAPEIGALIRGRWLGVVCLVLATVYSQARDLLDAHGPLWALAAIAGLYNLAMARKSRRRQGAQRLAMGSLLLDLLAITYALHFSGDMENPFLFAYSLPVVAGAVLLSRTAGYLLTTGALFLFAILIIGTHLDASPIHFAHHHLRVQKEIQLHEIFDPDRPGVNWDYIVCELLALFTVLFGSAFGFGALSDRVREKNAVILQEHQRMLLLLNILPEGIVLIGVDGSIILANPAARALLDGLNPGSLRTLDPELRLVERIAATESALQEFETNHRGRTLHHALARAPAGGPVVWMVRDLTDERRLMAQVIHRSKMADLGLLAAGIAHEIGNPLSSMLAILELMRMKSSSPELADRLRALDSHLGRIHRIVQDIGAFARPASVERARVAVGGVVETALRTFLLHAKSREMQIEIHLEEGEAFIEAAVDQIVQVLLNLLLNAADASEGIGKIVVNIAARAEEVEIAIKDQGKGMSEEVLLRIFTPFFTTKEAGQGQGLGLYVSESIVRAHGGSIRVQSSPGKGSTFVVRLPRYLQGVQSVANSDRR